MRDTIEVFAPSDGDVWLTNGAANGRLVIRDATARDRAVLSALQTATLSADELAREVTAHGHELSPKDAASTIAQLLELCVLEEPAAATRSGLTPTDRERFDRQLAYFADLEGQDGAYRAQRRLADARVLVLGCGGLGTWTAIGLLCSGVRRLTLVDPDAVALSNLNRQILFTPAQLGQMKVLAARRALVRFDPDATIDVAAERIEGADRLAALLRDVDFLVATADEPAGKIAGWVNDACLATATPWISAGQFPPHVRIGPLFVPHVTACHECLEHAACLTHPRYQELRRARTARSVLAATTGPASGMIGSALANDVVAHLSGVHVPATRGHAVLIDLRTLTSSTEVIARNPDCPACGDRCVAASDC